MTTPRFSLLPPGVRPVHYQLTISPDLDTSQFEGLEEVALSINEPVREIVLNAIDLELSGTRLTIGGRPLAPSQISYDAKAETVTLQFAESLPVGAALLSTRFAGRLNDQLQGFYRSTYQAPDGSRHPLAVTQFEATDARRAFPCWDEPAYKATFELSLVVPHNMAAISNTPELSRTLAGAGKDRVQFDKTPMMSTYLLAFVVGELEAIEGKAPNGTVIRVWSTPGQGERGRFALETSIRLLTYYNDYFGIPYPLPKLDHLAIPDFAAGAMENWGCITYREARLLFDPQNSSPGTRQGIVEVVAHEMAHMWFGDLVTMGWWNDLWLNESFASWMAAKAMDNLYPDWEVWTQFIMTDVEDGLAIDGLAHSHPIAQEVRHPEEVNQLFDDISYAKGASIIRMLEQFINPEVFQRGLKLYLSRHSYDNAEGADLWKAMDEASGQPVSQMMASWIQQQGYPVVDTEVVRRPDRSAVNLTQRRFLYRGAEGDPTLWDVPIRLSRRNGSETDVLLLSERTGGTTVPSPREDGWIKANAGATGFFRIHYSPDEMARLTAGVKARELDAPDRLNLLEDAYALSRACMIDATQYLELAGVFADEDNYSIWATLAGQLASIDFRIADEPYRPAFQAFGRTLLSKVVRSVGWEPAPGESHLRTLLRSVVLSQMGSFGDPSVLQEAASRFQRFTVQPSSLRPDIRAMTYGLAAEGGTEETFETVRRLARDFPLHEEKIRLLGSLTRFRQPTLVRRTLEMSLDSAEVRSQDTVRMVVGVAGNPTGRDMAWEFLKERWPEFDRRYGRGGFAIMRLVALAGNLATPAAQRDVESFFREHPAPAASRTVLQALERIELNHRWLERNRQSLGRWVEARR